MSEDELIIKQMNKIGELSDQITTLKATLRDAREILEHYLKMFPKSSTLQGYDTILQDIDRSIESE